MKRLLHLLWLTPLVVLGYLWMRAGWDLHYLGRVLWHRESSTSDYRWKASRSLPASSHPIAWREQPECARYGVTPPELEGGGALAFVVVRDGMLRCEWYGNGGAKAAPAAAFSATKTVTALLLARAVAARRIASLDDPITRYVPALATRDPRFEAVTLASLVDMRSGIAFEEDAHFPWVDQDSSAVYYASDLAATVTRKPRIASPPGPFLYNDYAPNLIGLALGAPLDDATRLWDELGAEMPAAWSVDDRGFPWLESGLVVTARDFARIGQLVLDGGKVGDRIVAPAAWVARSLDPAGRATAITFAGIPVGYHNAWWRLGDRDLVAMGRYGQIMVVDPVTRTVIVRLGLDGYPMTNIASASRLAIAAAAD